MIQYRSNKIADKSRNKENRMSKSAMKKIKVAAAFIKTQFKLDVAKKDLKRIYKSLDGNNKSVVGILYAYVGVE